MANIDTTPMESTVTEKAQLKQWFVNGAKPNEAQFWAWMDAFWHKKDYIPVGYIRGLDVLLGNKADSEQLQYYAKTWQDAFNNGNSITKSVGTKNFDLSADENGWQKNLQSVPNGAINYFNNDEDSADFYRKELMSYDPSRMKYQSVTVHQDAISWKVTGQNQAENFPDTDVLEIFKSRCTTG